MFTAIRRLLLVVAALLLAAAPARAFGLFGHGAISLKAAEQLGLSGDERLWFALGGIMGDLDKSDQNRLISDPFRRFLATFGRSYSFPALVDLHDRATLAELVEAASRTGNPLLEAWGLGVLSHRRADRTIDTYPDAAFHLDTATAEIAADVEIFRTAEGGRFRELLDRVQGDDLAVYSPRKHIPFSWWLKLRPTSLKHGTDHDDDVRAVDPFAQLIFDAWHRAHGASGGPRSVSDVWRQQAGFDALAWNYYHKSPFYPGRRDFIAQKGQAWLDRVRAIAFTDATARIVAETRAWKEHLAKLRAGQPTTRPVID
jgi:hypothetical protein